tara:strand:+ start:322 stop:489 length:168 start_codon:yes stop_codon:yes gene_type:complete
MSKNERRHFEERRILLGIKMKYCEKWLLTKLYGYLGGVYGAIVNTIFDTLGKGSP